VPVRVEFGLLGPLAVRVNGILVRVPRGKQRLLLALLLLRAGRTVQTDLLVDLLWDPSPAPVSATATVQNYVKRLRQGLGAAGRERICTQPGGYLIKVEPGELDAAAMELSLAASHDAARDADWPRMAERAAAALAFWRGDPLCDVAVSPAIEAERGRLAELRLEAHELRIEADLQLARHTEVVTELRQLACAAPLREHLHALLMRALYGSGRRAEALQAYQDARRILVQELGSEPGPELRSLHQQVLSDDPALAAPLPVGDRAQEVPRQLPAAVGEFTGRDDELATLTGLLGKRATAPAQTMVISAIGGTAGVGKTALAIKWAHQVAGQFPDGQLYVNLRGYDPDEPIPTADALAGFLRALGVPGQQIPDELEDRARLYRSRLAGRRVLVLLDNARDGAHVRSLLPGDPGCVAVVTSRDALAGLVAAEGARRLDLDVLPPRDAARLLRSLIGSRAEEDPDAVTELAGLCARLPLALRIAAEQVVSRPETTLRDLVAELAAGRLDGLDAGEDCADVRAVFYWSFQQLPADVASRFALLGLHPGGDLDPYAAAALTGTSPALARRLLGRLYRASLVQAVGRGRHGMHDLLRAYAREHAAAGDIRQCRSALARLFDYYLSAAAAAMDIVVPAEAHLRPRITPAAAALPAMPGEAEAQAWLDAERTNLVAVVAHCASQGWPRHAASLAATLFRYLISGSHLPEALTIYGHALQAARQSGDLAAEAQALNGLGGIAMMKGHFRGAASHYHAALEAYRRCGDRMGQARALYNLGVTEHQLHNLQSAAGYYRLTIAAYEEAGDRVGVAGALCSLSLVETDLGLFDQASEHVQRALPVFRQAKDHLREATALERIGELSLRRDNLTQATASFEQALTIFRRIGSPVGIAAELYHLGEVGVRQRDFEHAIGYLRQALALFRDNGGQFGELSTRLTLAEALHGAGQLGAARSELETALRLAAETGNTHDEARAHRNLAESHHAVGEDEQARHHWQQALDLYAQVDSPEADKLRARLTQAQPTSAAGRL
jgi:DNA-binding SARP family transcriptional activator